MFLIALTVVISSGQALIIVGLFVVQASHLSQCPGLHATPAIESICGPSAVFKVLGSRLQPYHFLAISHHSASKPPISSLKPTNHLYHSSNRSFLPTPTHWLAWSVWAPPWPRSASTSSLGVVPCRSGLMMPAQPSLCRSLSASGLDTVLVAPGVQDWTRALKFVYFFLKTHFSLHKAKVLIDQFLTSVHWLFFRGFRLLPT